MSKQDTGAWGFLVGSIFLGFGIGCVFMLSMRNESPAKPCQCKPAPTPAPCCKADDCRKELAQVDARFGDVWDELVEVQEQLAKVKPCDCDVPGLKATVSSLIIDQRKELESCKCRCSDRPACECKPAEKTKLHFHRVLKRCK